MGYTGTPPNQTYQRTDGVRTGAAVCATAKAAAVNDTAVLADARENDLANAINLLLLRNGGNQPTANMPWNGKRITDYGAATARTDATRVDQVQDGAFLFAAVAGTANAIELTLTPATTAAEGMAVVFLPDAPNTDATTIDLGAGGAADLEYAGAALVGGELQAGTPARAIFDGTAWQLENPYLLSRLASTANGRGASLVSIEDAAGNLTATNVEAALAEIFTQLAAPSNGLGASKIGIEDAAGNFAATTVETALAEIIADYAATTATNGASKIGIQDAGGLITATTVEGALAENRTAINARLVASNNLSDVGSAATAFATIKQAATTSATGVVELATSAETITGTDTSRAVTPAAFLAGIKGTNGLTIQRGYDEYTANTSLSDQIPADDSIPQITEGTELLSVSITPNDATNRLRVRFQGQGAPSTTGVYAVAALFRDSTANAVSSCFIQAASGSTAVDLTIEYEVVAGSTSATTFTIRVGPNNNSMRMNGTATGRLGGGTQRATLVVEEIVA